jgi:hypothetical protein
MRRKIKYFFLFVIVFSFAFLSCKKKEYPNLYFGYDYFPNTVGHFIIYECDSLVHTGGFGDSTYHYQIKEVIDSLYYNQGQLTQKIVRYKRTDTTIPWSNITIPEKVWTGALLSNMATRQEDNFNYVKLVFPPSINELWNGNSVNSLSAYNYEYTSLNSPYTLTTINTKRSLHFDSTLTVLEYKDSNLQDYGYQFEQYATGIGMIHRIFFTDTASKYAIIPPDTSVSTTSGVWYIETCLTSGYQ